MNRIAPLLLCSAFLPLWLDAELIAHWRFDEVSGSTANDDLGVHNATWVPGLDATPDWDANGILGGAINFPGFGNHQNYFSLPSIPALNGTPAGISISVWVKPKGQSGYRGILMGRNVNDGESEQVYGLGHEDTWIDGRVSGDSIDSVAGTVPISTEWIHLAWVWNNALGSQKLFINGVPSGPTGSYPANFNFLSNGEWRIGDDECCNNRNFKGLMDDLSVWNHPLSDIEVAELHFNGLNGYAAGIPNLPLIRNSLIITEIMYHPVDPSPEEITAGFLNDKDFEYIEIRNISDSTVSLLNIRFTKGIDFDFAGSAITSLAPGEYALVVSKLAAFEMRYGSGLPVAGEWSGNLSNGGERLKLSFGAGEPIHDFVYEDGGTWPEDPDQNGGSLVLRNSAAAPDHRLGFNWRTSLHFHGTPGTTDNFNFMGGGNDSLLIYATGGTPQAIKQLPDGNIAYAVTVNLLTDDLETSVEMSTDLQSWSDSSAILPPVSLQNLGNNRARITYQTMTPPAGKIFLRYRIVEY